MKKIIEYIKSLRYKKINEEIDLAMEEFEVDKKYIKRLRRLYKKGVRARKPELCAEANKRMYDFCISKGDNCSAEKDECYTCRLGMNADGYIRE